MGSVCIEAFSLNAPTVSSPTFGLLPLIISASDVDESLSESVLRYRRSLSESLGCRRDQFESPVLCCCHSFTISAACDFAIPVISTISRQLLPSTYFFNYRDTFSGSSLGIFLVTLSIGIVN
jgi:hypothetical protein